jgi:hypothetical protein
MTGSTWQSLLGHRTWTCGIGPCNASSEVTAAHIKRSRAERAERLASPVRTFCTVSRRPTGPLAPPTRRARLRSHWRSRYGGANAGWLARKAETFGPPMTYSSYPGVRPRGVHAPAAELSKTGQNPSRPSVTAGQPHPPSCLVNVHAKTTLTEPARPRRWQRSEAWTRVARTVDASASMWSTPASLEAVTSGKVGAHGITEAAPR